MPIPPDNPLCYVGTRTMRTVPRERSYIYAGDRWSPLRQFVTFRQLVLKQKNSGLHCKTKFLIY